ncbi:FAD-binding oxidoreductase [Pseudonocardia nigra]|uniref:FAD-binding oxidoreductase n=1 Tax=Pseudonocardia nigra TaxID=1921578 RepID=UPI001C5F1247|nr:FAD-binding oxidoreductase [Pseudonocardia nigra]
MSSTTNAGPVEKLASTFSGELIRPVDGGYEPARRVWNAAIDKRPLLIARPRGSADVLAAVRYAADQGLPVAVRCGGHSVAGTSVCDDGMLVDLSLMKEVQVDAAARTARAAGGVTWGEYDRATEPFGLASPGGRVTTTGIGGFTLGGGYGWLSPKHGLACDNLVSAEVVTADGRLLTANDRENSDLFWGLHGGGGNFGVVTSFEFRLHPVGPSITGGMLLHPLEQAAEVLRGYREYVDGGPDELSTAFALFPAPPEPFVPAELHGRTVLGMIVCHCGDPEEGARVVAPLRRLGPPAADLVGPMPYTTLQALLDPTAPPGWRWYNSGDHLAELTDEAIDVLVQHAPSGLAPLTQIIVFRHGGAVGRVPETGTAVGNRAAPYLLHPLAAWLSADDDDRHMAWLRDVVDAMKPYSTGGVYLNFAPDDDAIVPGGYSREQYARLRALKDVYEASNMFRFNHNIRPAT